MDNLFSLKEKNVILTGGCGNLGRTMAKHLLSFDANVFVVDVTEMLPDELNGQVHYVKCDLSRTWAIKKMFSMVERVGGHIDVLINNAAYGGGTGGKKNVYANLEDVDDEAWSTGLDGTVGVTFRCIRESVPYFARSGGGQIVNIASMYGMVSPDPAIYGDTGMNSPVFYGVGKAGVIQLTKYCASCLAKHGIRVNSITPGPFPNITPSTDNDFLSRLQKKTMLGHTGSADELAGALVLLCSDASSFMTGANIVVDGGWTAW